MSHDTEKRSASKLCSTTKDCWIPERMMLNFAESLRVILPVEFPATQRPGKRRILKQRTRAPQGKKSIHFNGSEENIKLITTTLFARLCYSCELCSQILARTLVILGDLDQRRNGSSVSTERWQICAKNHPKLQKKEAGKRLFLQRRKIWKQWQCRTNRTSCC